MAAIFNFDDICELEIEGNKFTVEVSKIRGDVGKALNGIAKEIFGIKGILKESGEEAAANAVAEKTKESIDLLLGAGAFDCIFEGKDITPKRCMQLITFVAAELEKYMSFPRNRAQRRKDESIKKG